MNKHNLKKISKSFSYVLRHRPDTIGITLDEAGWVSVDELLHAFSQHGNQYTRALLEDVVSDNDKQRFEFSHDGTKIRARQGHSVKINLAYESATPPDVPYHGTVRHNLDSILEKGLHKAKRHHVHMSTNKETMVSVAQRHGKPVLLKIDAKQMHGAGHEFYVTGNDVWLTDFVPREFLSVMDGLK